MEDISKSRQLPENKKHEFSVQSMAENDLPGQAEAQAAAAAKAKAESKAPVQVKVDPEKRAQFLTQAIRKMSDEKKIKPLKELAFIGGLDSLKYILPLSQYSSSFIRKLASNTVIKIVLRVLRDNEENPVLVLEQEKRLIDFLIHLDRKYE